MCDKQKLSALRVSVIDPEEDFEAINLQLRSWKREAELNAEFGDQLCIAMNLLRSHGIHVEYPWCWCNPVQDSENHWIHIDAEQ